jgi:hypothetical protein
MKSTTELAQRIADLWFNEQASRKHVLREHVDRALSEERARAEAAERERDENRTFAHYERERDEALRALGTMRAARDAALAEAAALRVALQAGLDCAYGSEDGWRKLARSALAAPPAGPATKPKSAIDTGALKRRIGEDITNHGSPTDYLQDALDWLAERGMLRGAAAGPAKEISDAAAAGPRDGERFKEPVTLVRHPASFDPIKVAEALATVRGDVRGHGGSWCNAAQVSRHCPGGIGDGNPRSDECAPTAPLASPTGGG